MPRQLGAGGTLPRLAVLTLLLCAVAASLAFGEVSDARSSPQLTPKRAPLHHVYWHFLRLQRHFDERAATLEQQGQTKEAQRVRTLLQKQLRFSNAQMAILRQAGQQMERDADAVWAKAMPIMVQDRAWLKLNGRSAGPPPGHAQVHALQEEREAVIRDAVARLNRRLGPTAAAQLQAHIEKEWAPRVTVHPFPPRDPLTHDSNNDSKSISHLEAQQ